MDKLKRTYIQMISAIASNGYLKGFAEGSIYKGDLKKLCVPGLNCYSCPGALGSCPIGSLQAVMGSIKYNFSFYILGLLTLMGLAMGRLVCGWLCPFGLVQDLLSRIPSRKFAVKGSWSNFRYAKYAVLAVFVILLPFVLSDELGMSVPYFCKWICPAGTLEAGIPLLLMNEGLRGAAGCLFGWKSLLLLATIVSSVFIYRPFCRFVCPLGAIYAIFNPISLCRLEVDKSSCISCGKCEAVCKMGVKPQLQPNSPECIRCGDCIKKCPEGSIELIFIKKDR
ncbi:hypothetical protein EAL2_808p07530 (plasmid) [Peptoclostridium acidaminophilum DSM 3953]|uniref:4Fe-4S ferredoxin-type domain-containing protein n=1 Tax=Peptoclostridium acidaminophilum DSM 3953 TaxID=1286171 RepID=W8UC09_PEPAC|nr:4Fe-4S binding protein [Peptoclostridium acidaminophilum]AHM58256.1 hypothetical protein EAL2_808p07530 [Peptoclostridium acidaminophilum DSM 3953]